MLKKITLSAAAAVAAMTALPAAAEAQGRGYYDNGYYQQSYRDDRYARGDRYYGRNYYGRNQYRRCSGTTGTIVGGAAGALLGREIAGRRGSRTTGTILGGVAGALLGREVGKSTCRNRY